MMASEKRQYRFGDFLLDKDASWLRQAPSRTFGAGQGEREVELSPKAFQVLCYLVEQRARLVSKQELMEALWKDTFVTDDALVQCITAIRRALGDDAEQPRYIRTKARVGYQFIAPVEVGAAEPTELARVAPVGRGTARALFAVMQAGYLTLYSLTLFYVDEAARVLAGAVSRLAAAGAVFFVGIVFLALCGVAVRLYLLAAVGFDHPETGRRFARLFPLLFLLDLLWALSPLLLVEKTGLLLALALVPVLAYGPFSQRALIRSAYATEAAG